MKKILYSISIIFIIVIFIFTITYNNKEKKILQGTINYQVKNEDVYTPNSYNEYIIALNESKEISKDFFASKDEINTAIYNLQTKIDNLDIKPDKTILKNKYEESIKIDLDLYLPNSTLKLKRAINLADEIINDENVVKEEVDEAIAKLNEALNILIIKPDKTVLNDLIIKAEAINEDTYTTVSYDSLKESIQNGYNIINDANATQNQVDNAIQLINDKITNLVVAHKGVYKITYRAYMLNNNHVGNEWGYLLNYNSNDFKNGDLITSTPNSNITLQAEVYEFDSIMDYGTSSINLVLKDGFENTTQVVVRENRGRYYGNTATWEVICYVKLVEIIS